jgi:hypothetical protein
VKYLEGEKNLGEDLAPQNNNPRFKSQYNKLLPSSGKKNT